MRLRAVQLAHTHISTVYPRKSLMSDGIVFFLRSFLKRCCQAQSTHMKQYTVRAQCQTSVDLHSNHYGRVTGTADRSYAYGCRREPDRAAKPGYFQKTRTACCRRHRRRENCELALYLFETGNNTEYPKKREPSEEA